MNSDGIYNYMKKQTGPDSVYLKTKEDLQTFVNNYDASIVGTTQSNLTPVKYFVLLQFGSSTTFLSYVLGTLLCFKAHTHILWVKTAGVIDLLHSLCFVVGVFSGSDSSRLDEFLKAAGLLREQFRFAHITDLQIAEEHVGSE